jgi:hypothetical protein
LGKSKENRKKKSRVKGGEKPQWDIEKGCFFAEKK